MKMALSAEKWKGNGKYFGPKRLGVEIRRCLVGTIYDRSITWPG